MTEPKARILVVDDDTIIADSLSELLDLEGYTVQTAGSGEAALEIMNKQRFDIVISDINMPGAGGFDLLRNVREQYPETAIVMMTGYGTIDSAVEAIKIGAYDYLTKPINDDEILLVVERSLNQQALVRENSQLRKQLDERFGLDSIVGSDHKMLKIYDLVESVADTPVTVLVQGESGTGKSMVARVLHHRSNRNTGPFVEVSCGAIPESLLESELFGHVKGSFTGAVNDKEGKFLAANGGTLFLDEINSASPALQVKLLRVLQEKQFEPVGSNETFTVDVRVVLAANVDLEKEVAEGRFRQDLFYRINVITLTMPSLRDRLSDIPLLSKSFLEKFKAQMKKPGLEFTDQTMECLSRYTWPGNVRELENVVERAVVLARSTRITPADLPPKILQIGSESIVAKTGPFTPMPLKEALEGPEKKIIEAALRANNWNRQATAEMLEINRTTLYKKMKRYDLDREPSMLS